MAIFSLKISSFFGANFLFDLIENKKLGYPSRYQKRLDHGMRIIYIFLWVFSLVAPFFLILLPFIDYFSHRSPLSLSTTDVLVLSFWTFNLLIAIRQAVVVSFLFIQQTYFLAVHFCNHFQFFHCKLEKILKRRSAVQKKNKNYLNDETTQKIIRLHQDLTAVISSFLKGQSQVKLFSYVLFITLMFSLEFEAYILIDGRTSSVVRTIVLSELPFIGVLVFINFYLASKTNSSSKRILPQLDVALYRLCWPRAQMSFKLTLMETRATLADDGLAVNLADVNQLTRVQVGATFKRMLSDLFLIIDLNH